MGRRRRLPLELAILGVVGFGCRSGGIGEGSGPIVVAVVEVADAAPVNSTAVIAADTRGAGTCTFDVNVDDIEPSSPTCTIYEQVSREGGRITMPCGGADGPAQGTFGEHDYRGEVRAKRIVLEHSYDFREQDGCEWRVHGRISGIVSSANELTWTYREEILEDDTSNCWATCTARTAMKLTPVR